MSKVLLVQAIARFPPPSSVDAYHAAIFHGVGGRDERWYPNDKFVWCGQHAEPLDVVLTSGITRSVFQPAFHLVCNQRIADSLRTRGFPTYSVRVMRYVDLTFANVSKIYGQDPEYSLLELPPMQVDDKVSRQEFFEMRACRLSDFIAVSSNIPSITAAISPDESIDLALPPGLLQRHPLLWSQGVFILAEGIGELIHDELDYRFFFKSWVVV